MLNAAFTLRSPRLDELSLDASCGSLEASIQLGKLEEASSQAMFLEASCKANFYII